MAYMRIFSFLMSSCVSALSDIIKGLAKNKHNDARPTRENNRSSIGHIIGVSNIESKMDHVAVLDDVLLTLYF